MRDSGDRMKIVVFRGSPRRGGNTDVLLEETLRAAGNGNEVVLFTLNDMNIRPCQNCGGCNETGICVLTDDMDDIYPAIREADRIIVASPIFFFGLSAQTKIMIDRCQAFWSSRKKRAFASRRRDEKRYRDSVRGRHSYRLFPDRQRAGARNAELSEC